MKKEYDQIYIVQKEDSLPSIAEKYHVNATTILLDNNLTPSMIKPGVAIYISNAKNKDDNKQ